MKLTALSFKNPVIREIAMKSWSPDLHHLFGKEGSEFIQDLRTKLSAAGYDKIPKNNEEYFVPSKTFMQEKK